MPKPNIVFILADDLGYADLSCYGRIDYETPYLDALARSGLRLTQGYANSAVCSATRVALITGNYQHRYTLGLHEPVAGLKIDPLPQDTPTLPRYLKQAGYRTHLVGKWHLGSNLDQRPNSYGYDNHFGFLGGAVDYFRHRWFTEQDVPGDGLVWNDKYVERQGYLTELLGDETVKIIDDSADSDDPFFISLHFNAPHWPWEGPNDEEVSRNIKDLAHRDGGNIRVYGQMVQSMDYNIGKVVEALRRTGKLENTLIVFTSDNGGERFSDTWPFIGIKSELFEGGLRVPLLFSWPAQFEAGRVLDQVATTMDFLPTLVAAAGATIPPENSVDGENLLPVLRGDAEPHPRKLFWRFKANEQAAVRDGDWKYLRISGREWLFNLADDERERADKHQLFPSKFDQLKREFEAWSATMLTYTPNTTSMDVHSVLFDRY